MKKIIFIFMLTGASLLCAAASESEAPVVTKREVFQFLKTHRKLTIDCINALEIVVDDIPDDKVKKFVELVTHFAGAEEMITLEHIQRAVEIVKVHSNLNADEMFASAAIEKESQLWENFKYYSAVAAIGYMTAKTLWYFKAFKK